MKEAREARQHFGRDAEEVAGAETHMTPAEVEYALIHASWAGPAGYESVEATTALVVTPSIAP